MPKEKFPSKKLIKKILWFFISLYVRLRDTDERGYGKCISCPSIKYWRHNGQIKIGLEPGHFIANAISKFLTYNLDNLNGQCYQCNDMKHGNYPWYEDGLIEKIGLEKVNYLKQSKSILKNWKDWELMDMIRDYQLKLYEIIQTKDIHIQKQVIEYIYKNIPKKWLSVDYKTLITN